MNMENNIKRFEEEMTKINKPGIEALMKYIKKSDMYIAPSSTRFHLSIKGGLLQHSLNVFSVADKFPIIWALHTADMMAAHCMEGTEDNKRLFGGLE